MLQAEETRSVPTLEAPGHRQSRREALSVGAWRRIAVVAAAISVLLGGATIYAAQSGATQSNPVQRDRLVRFEQMGCTQIESFPKHGWICVDR
jgi:hypothetical protein